jgi:hypothetical protein
MADGDSRTLHRTTEAAAPAVIFSGTDADVLTGSVSGMSIGGDYIDVTFSGGDVLSLPLESIAQDQGANGFTTIPIPPMTGVSTIEVTGAYDVVGALIVEA